MTADNIINSKLVCLSGINPLKSSSNDSLPSRIKLLGWGANKTSEGLVIVDELTAKVFAANQKAVGRERVVMDFEHNTVPGTTEYNRTNEPRSVAGHANLVCIPGEGIFAEAVTYTATGKKTALDFEDVSLAPYLDKEHRVIAAHSFALTHTGAAYGIIFESVPETLSARSTPPTKPIRSVRWIDSKGVSRVDLAVIFDNESRGKK